MMLNIVSRDYGASRLPNIFALSPSYFFKIKLTGMKLANEIIPHSYFLCFVAPLLTRFLGSLYILRKIVLL